MISMILIMNEIDRIMTNLSPLQDLPAHSGTHWTVPFDALLGRQGHSVDDCRGLNTYRSSVIKPGFYLSAVVCGGYRA